MSKLKVLMLGWEFAPAITGGLGVVCRDLTEQLAKSGIHIKFVLPKIPQSVNVDFLELFDASNISLAEQSLQYEQVNVTLLPYANHIEHLNLFRKFSYQVDNDAEIYGLNMFDEMYKFAARVSEIASSSDFDLIHAHDWMNFPAAINAKEVSGKPLVVHIHATEHDRSGGNPYGKIFEIEKAGVLAADRVIAVSEKTKQMLIDHYSVQPEKVIVVHNAVHKNEVNAKPLIKMPVQKDEKIVLFLGRLSIQKGADFLLQAAAKVLHKMKNVKFVIVGKGDMLKRLIDMSIDLGISRNVLFAGALSYDQVDRAYTSADLFVMPSVSEPFGITSLEAIRNGTPVLMSKQSGASEVVNNCLKVDFWDINEMANKILAVLHHSSLATTLVQNSKHDLERISWETQAQKVKNLYNELIFPG